MPPHVYKLNHDLGGSLWPLYSIVKRIPFSQSGQYFDDFQCALTGLGTANSSQKSLDHMSFKSVSVQAKYPVLLLPIFRAILLQS